MELGLFFLQSSNLKSSFQAGVDSIYNKCDSCGSTPTAKTPSAVVTAIANIYNNRYNTGYNAGRGQGQNDVTSNPNGYGLYTGTQYNNYGTSQYNAGISAGISNSIYKNCSTNIGVMSSTSICKVTIPTAINTGIMIFIHESGTYNRYNYYSISDSNFSLITKYYINLKFGNTTALHITIYSVKNLTSGSSYNFTRDYSDLLDHFCGCYIIY